MGFKDVLGQKQVIDSLIKAINNNMISHAYLFEGPCGIGKKTVAKAFVQAVMCENDFNGCNTCRNCLLIEANNHPDVKFISYESSIGVDSIREIVKDIRIKPYYKDRKIYIIENAEKMTIQAQNSLLKTLEEPPEYALIILTATSSNLLLPTIVSRCTIKKFAKNTESEVAQYINTNYKEDNQDLKFIVSLSNGIIGNAINFTNPEFINLRKQTISVAKKLLTCAQLEALLQIDFFNASKDNIDFILNNMLLLFRDVLVYKETQYEQLIINSDYTKDILELSKTEILQLSNGIQAIIEAQNNLLKNANYTLTIEVMILKINNSRGINCD